MPQEIPVKDMCKILRRFQRGLAEAGKAPDEIDILRSVVLSLFVGLDNLTMPPRPPPKRYPTKHRQEPRLPTRRTP